jgi:hypothetical protein
MHLLFVGHYQDKGMSLLKGPKANDVIVLEDGYLEKLFMKESRDQGKHFDAPESVSKIVHSFISRVMFN